MAQQINLLSPLFQQRATPFGARFCLAVIVMVLLVLALMGVGEYRQLQQLRQQLADLQAAKSQKTASVEAYFKSHTTSQNAAQQLADSERMLQTRLQILQRFQRDERRAPFSAYLDAFARIQVDGVRLAHIRVAGDALELEGRAQTAEQIPRYLLALQAQPVFHGRQFAAIHIDQTPDATGTGLRFQLTNPGATAPTPAAGGAR